VEDLRIGKQSMATLSSYGKAINCLVKALRDPIKVKEPYTLAAVFMITVCQVKGDILIVPTYKIFANIDG
jgi:hypothetical protein